MSLWYGFDEKKASNPLFKKHQIIVEKKYETNEEFL